MTTAKYTAKSGAIRYRPLLSLEEAQGLVFRDDLQGFCLACAEEQRAEPDARRQRCESCGEHLVYGIEELLLMGIALIDGEAAR